MLSKGGQLKLPEPRNPEDVGKTDDPRYCLYHRGLGHPTKNCWSLKGKLQSLVDAGSLRLKMEYKTTTGNMTSCLQFGQSPPTPTAVYPISAVEMRIVNSNTHSQQEKGLVSTPTPGGGTMCMCPDFLDDVHPWTTVSHKKSRGKTKQANDIIASIMGPDLDVNSLTHFKKEEEGPHHQQEEGLLPLPVPDVGVMSDHPDLLDDNRQHTARSCRKANGEMFRL